MAEFWTKLEEGRIRRAGTWDEFLGYVGELREEGLAKETAIRKALKVFDPSGEKERIEKGDAPLKRWKGRAKAAIAKAEEYGAEIARLKGELRAERERIGELEKELADKSRKKKRGLGRVPKEIAERSCSEVEQIRWVARNMEANVGMADCPDPAAWGLLKQCRRDEGFRSSFWSSMYTKILPSKAQIEALDAMEDDEDDNTIGLLERIEEASREVIE